MHKALAYATWLGLSRAGDRLRYCADDVAAGLIACRLLSGRAAYVPARPDQITGLVTPARNITSGSAIMVPSFKEVWPCSLSPIMAAAISTLSMPTIRTARY